jgi:hypothetical protein
VFQPFPAQVAKPLRRALYYTNISLSPKDALKYYKQALAIADEIGMDPFSDEILGVKIQVAALMEKIQQYEKSIEVLEIIRSDCLKWIELLGSKSGNEGKRTRVLGKTVAISVKLGDLYANYYIQDKETAEERLVWAVETALKEKKRREEEGVKEGEGDWMTDEEFGGALECKGPRFIFFSLSYDAQFRLTTEWYNAQRWDTTMKKRTNTTSPPHSSSNPSLSHQQTTATLLSSVSPPSPCSTGEDSH